MALSPLDPSSYSRPELAIVKNINLNLSANFHKKTFKGSATLSIEKTSEDVTEVILDSKDLNITKIVELKLGTDLQFNIDEAHECFGSKLVIKLPENESKSYTVQIEYETSANASGLQWLSKEQTADKKHPYLFSQFQAIHARSFLPCQDTPNVKAPYTATISAPPELTVLMSAIRDETKELKTANLSHFVQKVPIPSYLIAIAIGALECKEIGPRSKVWTEKSMLKAAAWEFAETEQKLAIAEEICGPYVWGTYDLLVLPPSFPFGGMENPCLTFITPTVLALDKSLVDVIAHEIAHSWTGNLITNKNFEHFWLNEGFTMLVERKITGRLTSSQGQDFSAFRGVSDLKEEIALFGADNPLTKLVVDLKGVDPDEAFSSVPYEKGYTFLRYLENIVDGPDHFEPFLRKYFDAFKYKSIKTDDFKNFFLSEFSACSDVEKIDWNAWLYEPGMPPLIPEYDTTLANICNTLKETIISWDGHSESLQITEEQIESLTAEQVIYLLQEILESSPQPVRKLNTLETLFKFDKTKNSEIKFRWLRIGLKAHWEEKVAPALNWVNEIGRMKFVRPIYRDLYDWELSRQKAIDNFMANKKFMMHVTAAGITKDLHL